jgi:FMN phosphatase YigB (HAD superfamily)
VADPRPPLVLVTDFDGTLYRGDAPIHHYAEQAAVELSERDRRALLEAVGRYLDKGVAAADDAPDAAEAEALRAATDGWEAVAQVAGRRHGVDKPRLDRAFLATRAYMATDACPLEVPEEYRALLTGLRLEGVRVVLATNSPADALDVLLDRLRVRPLLDEVVHSTGKPAGLARLLRAELGAPHGDGAAAVEGARGFALGDHWANDIAPAREVAVATGYIDRYGRQDGPATAVARDVEGLLPAVRAWADAAVRLEL